MLNSSVVSAGLSLTSIPDIDRENVLLFPAPMVSDSGPSNSPSNGTSYVKSTVIGNSSSLETKKLTITLPPLLSLNGSSSSS